LIPRSDEFKGQGHQGQKSHFSTLSAACMRFTFGKTSLANSLKILAHRYQVIQLSSIENVNKYLEFVKSGH